MGGFSRTRLGESSLAWASPLLAQKWGPSLRLHYSHTPRAPTRSCLGECLSPERDGTSFKPRPSAWARARARAGVCPLQVSPRRDRVAWARITGLAHCSSYNSYIFHTQTMNPTSTHIHSIIQDQTNTK